MRLDLNSDYYLSEIGPQDVGAYVEHLKEREIIDTTLTIPFPYTEAHAKDWIERVAKETKTQGQSINWAIRRKDGFLIGSVGFHEMVLGKSHRAELGYWVAKPYWGKGIMTAAVKKVSDYAFKNLGLVRITAGVFIFNPASAKVLEKAGFHLEGILRKHYKKDGKIFDGKLYAKILP